VENIGKTNEELEMPVIHVSDYVSSARVAFWEKAEKEEVLRGLCGLSRGAVGDSDVFLEAVFQREAIMSTGLGMGVAFPHVKIPSIPEFFITVGIIGGNGVEWDAFDGNPVKAVFLIGGPDGQQTRYLGILSKLSLIVKNERVRNELFATATPEDVAGILGRY